MQISVPFDVGDYVEDLVTHEILEVTGIQFRHGKIGHETNWYRCISINTSNGMKCQKDLKRIEFDISTYIDNNGV